MSSKLEATIEDLYYVPENGKAEIVDGKLVFFPPLGAWPNRASGTIYVSLRNHERNIITGRAYIGTAAFIVHLPNRKSFSPDVSFYIGPFSGMKFLQGAPIFAVEVRSEGDYGSAAERKIRQKINDYFAAGTKVVRDVDLLSYDIVKVYRADDPDNPTIYRRDDIAEAEPAVPGWRIPVAELFA
ncbi:MAG TPA: Uma2 family endonuclease [Blastocatellia bacterium]|nr:Uma2 family endonuclease [Blastocatellia bacterium]